MTWHKLKKDFVGSWSDYCGLGKGLEVSNFGNLLPDYRKDVYFASSGSEDYLLVTDILYPNKARSNSPQKISVEVISLNQEILNSVIERISRKLEAAESKTGLEATVK